MHPKSFIFWLVNKLAINRTLSISKAANFLSNHIVLVVILKLISVLKLSWEAWECNNRMSARSRMKIIMDNLPRRVFTKIGRNWLPFWILTSSSFISPLRWSQDCLENTASITYCAKRWCYYCKVMSQQWFTGFYQAKVMMAKYADICIGPLHFYEQVHWYRKPSNQLGVEPTVCCCAKSLVD